MALDTAIRSILTSLDLPSDILRMLESKQTISETKFDTVVLAAGALASNTAFFQGSPGSDPSQKNFDNGCLVGGTKFFLVQNLTVQPVLAGSGCTAQNIVDLINRCAIQLQIDNKVFDRHLLSQCSGGGGAFINGHLQDASGNAIASSVVNGMPQSRPFRLKPFLVEPQKLFLASLLAPTAGSTVITLGGTLALRIALSGIEFRSIQ